MDALEGDRCPDASYTRGRIDRSVNVGNIDGL